MDPKVLDYCLCYIDGRTNVWAWFTSCPLEKQWGDDWDDAPYEHNAGQPYTMTIKEFGIHGIAIDHNLFRVAVDRERGATPCEGSVNSQWSVQDINNKHVAWLRFEKDAIHAGTTLRDFIEIVKRNGGQVYLPVEP